LLLFVAGAKTGNDRAQKPVDLFGAVDGLITRSDASVALSSARSRSADA